MIVVTGATGKLGRMVIDELLTKVPASDVVAAVRSPEKATELKSLGVALREADFDRPETLAKAFAGADKVLLISSTAIGPPRVVQHRAAIDAAKAAGVRLLAYTSVLRADTSTLPMAADHKATEEAIQAAGIPYVLLRNGWYFENRTEALGPVLEHGAMLGAAKEGKFSFAGRADYAAAAAAALAGDNFANRTLELAGDRAYTLAELAAEVSRQAGKAVVYKDLPEKEFEGVLAGFGLPKPLAEMLARSDAEAAKGEVESDSPELRETIGRPTMRIEEAVRRGLQG